MLLLTASAVINLASGIYQSVDAKEGGSKVEWVEGVSIIVAVVIITLTGAINDFQKDRKFEKLNRKTDERDITVFRPSNPQRIPIQDILVGDVVHLETGDVVPADGVLIDGFSIQCDESSSTGESDLISKIPATHVTAKSLSSCGPFILSGSKIASGVGTFLVTSVVPSSSYGRILMSLHAEPEETPLQHKLGVLAKYTIDGGLLVGGVFFLILFIRFLVDLKNIEGGGKAKGEEFLDILILAITVVVIAVPEGLPLTVTLALAFATTRMLKDQNLVRLLRSCEVMGNATSICSDKTGTLTQNRMTDKESSPDRDKAIIPPAANVVASLPHPFKQVIKDSILLNSTAQDKSTENGMEISGSSTEVALVNFATKHFDISNLSSERARLEIVQLYPFNADKRYFRMFLKGAPEIVLDLCTQQGLADSISEYSSQSLRSIATAYRDLESWPPENTHSPGSEPSFNSVVHDMVFLSLFALQDPLRPEVAASVRDCQTAGVRVRMVTGDNFLTAKSIAQECGIYGPGGIALDGPTFRKLSTAQINLLLPRLQVLARSSPEDKLRLVTHLKGLGETVAVTGDGINDALALKAADVGFAMGIAGTEVAKEASSTILMDDNFASIVKALLWGRAVNDAARKFLQFQFTINLTAGVLTMITVLVGGTSASVFTVVQLLWINLIMDTFAALALATDYPTKSLIYRTPEPRNSSIVNISMWKMITGQCIYQLVVIFVLHYAGQSLFGYHTEQQQAQLQTMIFNIYLWMQFCNMFNSRRVDAGFNFLEGLLRNPAFFFVQSVIAAGQIVIIFKGGKAFGTEPLTGA
ncbi:calcium-translocating P-type ATPase [Aspergillus steynii IBT 23096]|uniref:Calcium-transporting ATPase n=1 Tax=Aspergillus steynii IBT 23096 TaxID=1392250 RepID=A0A2I2G5L0_9EURO|nr:calcium-translocating P-type ATPase [Aspergillus steynii IBT 23096]PLB48169.1 calcium-translocating P-type ATPase [Aspergillus steynii IBT 23096]